MIVFNNPGNLDLNAIRLMGVSVKSESAIGYFGTGLKFGIATLLRTGHSVRIYTSGVWNELSTRPIEVRGRAFSGVYLNDEALGFTTELGRNWETWMAFRELYSNMLDEKGWIGGDCGDTSIEVSGPEIDLLFHQRSQWFLDSPLLAAGPDVSFHAGASQTIFYRGVAVSKADAPFPYTVNILGQLELTEDRTLRYQSEAFGKTRRNFLSLTDPDMLKTVFLSPCLKDWYFHYGTIHSFSDEAKKVASELLRSGHRNSFLSEFRKALLTADELYEPLSPTTIEQKTLDKAREMLEKTMGVSVGDIVLVQHLEGAYALYDPAFDKIVITRQAVANGKTFVAATLFEEWCHKELKMIDESRPFQQYLIDRLIGLAEAME